MFILSYFASELKELAPAPLVKKIIYIFLSFVINVSKVGASVAGSNDHLGCPLQQVNKNTVTLIQQRGKGGADAKANHPEKDRP